MFAIKLTAFKRHFVEGEQSDNCQSGGVNSFQTGSNSDTPCCAFSGADARSVFLDSQCLLDCAAHPSKVLSNLSKLMPKPLTTTGVG